MFAAVRGFFRNYHVSIDIAMNEMTIDLGQGQHNFEGRVITLLRTVPRIPIRQCSFVRTKTASVLSSSLLRRIGICPLDFHSSISAWFVLTHTMSSARRNPHLCKSARPTSNESLLGSQRNKKLGVAASDSIGRDARCVISAK
jgi:hypothetical protein